MSKDYYRILGVLDDAEDIVIRAAYKALAQRYHPDKWVGDKAEATMKMADINEAFDVLSDPVKRKKFDEERGKSQYSEEDLEEEDDMLSSLESDWKEVLEYFPDLSLTARNLSKISKQLEFAFKSILLESKRFNDRNLIAKNLEEHFLQKYFGKNKKILDYARKLILDGDKKAAKDLNRAIDLLGSEVDPDLIIRKVSLKNQANFTSTRSGANFTHATQYAHQFMASPCFYYAKCLIEAMGGEVVSDKHNLANTFVDYQEKKYTFNKEELFNFAYELAKNLKK